MAKKSCGIYTIRNYYYNNYVKCITLRFYLRALNSDFLLKLYIKNVILLLYNSIFLT